jgi:hypothetical protein
VDYGGYLRGFVGGEYGEEVQPNFLNILYLSIASRLERDGEYSPLSLGLRYHDEHVLLAYSLGHVVPHSRAKTEISGNLQLHRATLTST